MKFMDKWMEQKTVILSNVRRRKSNIACSVLFFTFLFTRSGSMNICASFKISIDIRKTVRDHRDFQGRNRMSKYKWFYMNNDRKY